MGEELRTLRDIRRAVSFAIDIICVYSFVSIDVTHSSVVILFIFTKVKYE